MRIFINGTGNVSPQKTWDPGSFLEETKDYYARMMQCLEPETDPGLDEKYLRRMSRMIRLGWLASRICLSDAGNPVPDAIITGSGWGSVMDSEKFLLSIYRNKESLLPPTPFIQSTHNAVGAQIAMLLNNSAYNVTYAHSSFSFEHAMLDAIISLKNNDYQQILLGGVDEVTENQFILSSRQGRWRTGPVNNLELFDNPDKGTIAGEGFTFFFLSGQKSLNTYAAVKDVMTIFSCAEKVAVTGKINAFLQRNGLAPGNIDWVVAGLNGDSAGDPFYHEILGKVFSDDCNLAAWKHLTGDYLTATAFATWAAAKALKNQLMAPALVFNENEKRNGIRNILIYNHFKKIHHSLILLTNTDEF